MNINKNHSALLTDPKLAPKASAFLWNKKMMLQITCRGFAVAQYMDPEPRKYAHSPSLAAQTFMHPEHPYFAHHPGRFFYLRNDETGELFSVPYEPVRKPLDHWEFRPGLAEVRWLVRHDGLEIDLSVGLVEDDVVEVWEINIKNTTDASKKYSVVPYFPVGYSSWMNYGANYDTELNASVATCITPYQKVDQYFKNKHLKDLTFLAADHLPDAHESSIRAFEGETGLQNPEALLDGADLQNGEANYELPACIMQFKCRLGGNESKKIRFLFGPAKSREEISAFREKYLGEGLAALRSSYSDYVCNSLEGFQVKTEDAGFDDFANYWLPRQVFYHGDTNRLTTDPQTRNYLQDAMGMIYINPAYTRSALLLALGQQKTSGEMPDGILLDKDAELKYINLVPHTDHPVWLIITIEAYLDETGDVSVLREPVPWADSGESSSVFEHLRRAMEFMIRERDERGLSYIAQGDWCDPMNMVGYKGRGVSGWLSQAVSFALQRFAAICNTVQEPALAAEFVKTAHAINAAVNHELWDGKWYARGITDDNVVFGIAADRYGKIFLNSQSWAILARMASDKQIESMLSAVDDQLKTPFGYMMYAPSYVEMREDVGRVTQKWPGSAENGSVYNHAAAYFAYSLYQLGDADRAFDVLRKMIPGPDLKDIQTRGQLPVYIPNYYRGAYFQFPKFAGRSSQLFNTGTVAWYYRIMIENMFGLKGTPQGLAVKPLLPSHWSGASCVRRFRGATFHVEIARSETAKGVFVDGSEVMGIEITDIEPGRSYRVQAFI